MIGLELEYACPRTLSSPTFRLSLHSTLAFCLPPCDFPSSSRSSHCPYDVLHTTRAESRWGCPCATGNCPRKMWSLAMYIRRLTSYLDRDITRFQLPRGQRLFPSFLNTTRVRFSRCERPFPHIPSAFGDTPFSSDVVFVFSVVITQSLSTSCTRAMLSAA